MSVPKLADQDIWYIRQGLLSGSRVEDLARIYSVSCSEILRVASGVRRGGEKEGDPLVLRYKRRTGQWVVERRAGEW